MSFDLECVILYEKALNQCLIIWQQQRKLIGKIYQLNCGKKDRLRIPDNWHFLPSKDIEPLHYWQVIFARADYRISRPEWITLENIETLPDLWLLRGLFAFSCDLLFYDRLVFQTPAALRIVLNHTSWYLTRQSLNHTSTPFASWKSPDDVLQKLYCSLGC